MPLVLNAYSVAFVFINATLLLLLPTRWALLPVLTSACYMTGAHGVEFGPFHFTVIRLMVFVGIVRIILRGERLNRHSNALDWLIVLWATWLLTSSFFQHNVSSALVYRLGLIYDALGVYFLTRVFFRSTEDLPRLYRMIIIVLAPVAAEMVFEKIAVYNLFSTLGGVGDLPEVRHGNVRAQGPFQHSILAGTVGASCLPFAVSLWKLDRKTALAGTAACLSIVYASAASGPIMSTLAAVFWLLMWRFRDRVKLVVWGMIAAYVALDIVMNDPAYFIMARIDITGGSQAWYRARLIQSWIEHFSEWWLVGTDYTRHWMSTGIVANPNHVDITNHYIKFAVLGGLPLMVIFLAQLIKGFSYVNTTVRHSFDLGVEAKFVFPIWGLGAALFVHAVTCISISYFDQQSSIFLYITLAAISGARFEATLGGKLEEKKS